MDRYWVIAPQNLIATETRQNNVYIIARCDFFQGGELRPHRDSPCGLA
jgi:hypothetical protein